MQMGKMAIDRAFKDYEISYLYGLTPVHNKSACKFVQKLGFKPVHISREIGHNEREDTYYDALLTEYSHDQL